MLSHKRNQEVILYRGSYSDRLDSILFSTNELVSHWILVLFWGVHAARIRSVCSQLFIPIVILLLSEMLRIQWLHKAKDTMLNPNGFDTLQTLQRITRWTNSDFPTGNEKTRSKETKGEAFFKTSAPCRYALSFILLQRSDKHSSPAAWATSSRKLSVWDLLTTVIMTYSS